MKLVGILNITPDSFSDGGRFINPAAAIAQAKKLLYDGADLIDIGAESTRPGATPITVETEWQRLEPVLQVLVPAYPGKISLDSYHPEVVERALQIGPVIINDITGMNNPAMVDIAVAHHAIVIVSHLPNMAVQHAHQQKPIHHVEHVQHDLLAKATVLQARGLPKNHIILDPGIGFGKIPTLNWQLLRFAAAVSEYAIMIGYSRKGFLGPNRMELEPNLEAGRIAASAGAAYIRVHDVAGHIALTRS